MRRHRWPAAALLATWVAACSSQYLIADPATALQPSPSPIRSVRVTQRGGQQLTLQDPVADGDSLRGRTLNGRTVALAFADLERVESSRTNVVATVAVVTAATVLLGYTIWTVALQGSSSWGWTASE